MAKPSVSKRDDLVSVTNPIASAATKEPAKPAIVAAPTAAALIVSELAISSVRLDGGTQSRIKLSTATIAEYAAAMREGAKFPPPVVFYDGKAHWLADGFHRVTAHLEAEHTHVACEVRQGSQRDAILFSVSANARHGLRRTNADKRRAVELLILDPEWAQWSSREIAKAAAVDDKFVGKIRSKVSATADGPQLATRTGADGKVRKVPKPKKRGKAFNVERAAKAVPTALDKIARQWPANAPKTPLVQAVRAWLAAQNDTLAKAAE